MLASQCRTICPYFERSFLFIFLLGCDDGKLATDIYLIIFFPVKEKTCNI